MSVISRSEKAPESLPKLDTQARSALGPQPLSTFAPLKRCLLCWSQVPAIEKKVSFAETEEQLEDDEQSLESSDESFCEIVTTSEPESLSSSGEEDVEMLETVLERAYTCSRGMFSSKAYAACDPAERSSLLLLDKELLAVEGIRQLSLASPSSPSVSLLTPLLALNPGFLFWILFYSFWQKLKRKA